MESAGPKKPRTAINVVLFFLTVLSTTIAGALLEGAPLFRHWNIVVEGLRFPVSIPLPILGNWHFLAKGFPFSLALIAILSAHEMSHYFASKRYGINVSLPYFIPAPTIFGTFGAIIKIRSPLTDRKAIFDIGLAGPLAGAIIAMPVLYIGLKMSCIKMMPRVSGEVLGSSILLNFMVRFALGNLPPYYQISLHPVASAAWVGLLVTSLNLMPVGQLDGGHISYALLGEKAKGLGSAFIIGLIILAVFVWPVWLVWATVLYFMGVKHPAPLNPYVRLDLKRKLLGILAFFLFIITFTPIPITIG